MNVVRFKEAVDVSVYLCGVDGGRDTVLAHHLQRWRSPYTDRDTQPAVNLSEGVSHAWMLALHEAAKRFQVFVTTTPLFSVFLLSRLIQYSRFLCRAKVNQELIFL